MAYFNHAFYKSFLAVDASAANGTKTQDLTAGQLALVDGKTWKATTGAVAVPGLAYLVQGSLHASDTIGGNGNHGGYAESVKSKGINPKYLTRIWESECIGATPASVTVAVGSKCHPCGENLMLRLDVKGAPALRFLNRNAYAIGDSIGEGSDPGLCCIEGQEFLDPAVALAKIGRMIIADAIVAPFIKEGGIRVTVAGVATSYTFAEVVDGTYTPSTDPVGDEVTAAITFQGAYVDTKFGDCSFDTRDYHGKEPVQLVASMLDETGNPCNDCGTVTSVAGTMQQTSGEGVLRNILLTESYGQAPFHQGNVDAIRMREIEGSEEVISAVDRSALYKTYYVQHSIPRLNNATSVFDNDQYVYEIFVKCDDSATQLSVEALLDALVDAANVSGNPLERETTIDQQVAQP
tara:strand:+ start:2668 stop:3888 length:1221 start_codon:yes stop_codon:yes gene_type:complete